MIARAVPSLLAGFLLACLPAIGNAQQGLNNSLVAMVRVTSNGAVVSRGAALVVHQSEQRTLLVTAYHVIRDDDQWKGKAEVEFFGRRGTFYPTTYNSEYADKALDLAVLFVDHTSSLRPPSVREDLAQGVVAPTTETALIGSQVRIVGFMGLRPWSRTAASDRVFESNARRVAIKSTAAEEGASGGAVIDSLDRLVAMGSQIVRTSDGPLLNAIPMSALSGRLADWGLPFDLRKTDAPSASGAIAQRLRDEMKLNVTYAPTSPEESSGGAWTHLYRAVVPPDIAPLVSQVVLEYIAGPSPVPQSFELTPPEFARHVVIRNVLLLHLKQFVVLRDGRKLGPYESTIDLAAGPAEHARGRGETAMRYFAANRDVVKQNAENEERNRRNFAASQSSNARRARAQQADSQVANLKSTYAIWRIGCQRIKEPTIDVWECTGGAPMAGGFPANLPATAVFERVLLGADQERVIVPVPLEERDFGKKFLEHAATLLKDGARELYVTVSLLDGTVLGPKRLCVVFSGRTEGCA